MLKVNLQVRKKHEVFSAEHPYHRRILKFGPKHSEYKEGSSRRFMLFRTQFIHTYAMLIVGIPSEHHDRVSTTTTDQVEYSITQKLYEWDD